MRNDRNLAKDCALIIRNIADFEFELDVKIHQNHSLSSQIKEQERQLEKLEANKIKINAILPRLERDYDQGLRLGLDTVLLAAEISSMKTVRDGLNVRIRNIIAGLSELRSRIQNVERRINAITSLIKISASNMNDLGVAI